MTIAAWIACLLLGHAAADRSPEPPPSAHVVVVIGAAGTEEFGMSFRTWASRIEAAARRGNATFVKLDGTATEAQDATVHHERLHALVNEVAARTDDRPLWLILMGHGTFDGREAKFNLRGPDVSSTELGAWLRPLERPVALVACCSSSGPFVNHASRAGHVVVTACRSGEQYSYARFGEFFSRAFEDPGADVDRDGQVSLLEAFLHASQEVAGFYAAEARLATEHALLDDDGDGLGVSASAFRGVRCTIPAPDGQLPEGVLAQRFVLVPSPRERAWPAEERARRDALELEVERLRVRREDYAEADWLEALEPLLLELARLHARRSE